MQNSTEKWQSCGRAKDTGTAPKNCASQTALLPCTAKSIATNEPPLKENNSLAQEMDNVATSKMPQSPKSNTKTEKPVTPSDARFYMLNQKMKEEERYQKTLPDTLKLIRTFKNNQKNITSSISLMKIIASNDPVKNTIRLGSVNEIESACSSASKAIQALQLALKLEKAYQLGIAYSRPTNVKNKRIAVINALENLEKAVYEEYREVKSVANSLALLIKHLEAIYGRLFNVFRIDEIDNILDEIDNMRKNVKQLFIGDDMQLKKSKTIIVQLEQIVSDQRNVVRSFIKKASEMEEPLESIQKKDLVTLIRSLERIRERIRIRIRIREREKNLLELKTRLNLASNIIEGKVKNLKCLNDIITDLELGENDINDIKEILNSIDLKTKKAEIAKKIENVVNNISKLEKEFKIEMESKSKEMVTQITVLEEPLLKMEEMYDELCQNDIFTKPNRLHRIY
ncbi:hypothetical protein [Cardinium endosymbiont of Dermatophagoides farinae]|uniref:hypothetical protein n=1 Tax=Cardinium endosymbiont of Dermatophagoides farinae TaxID=2597823 RepID=UPI0011829031|nr:hypothetical protein [Cardinium endosymbiont of Dermatophagoides farinae]TSJ80627.1 hypothetical protein FPG78_00875 [Cardinium endosymbiont of Dermatophagoides farinae]